MSSHAVIGKAITKKDALDKVTGAGRYTADVNLPDMLYARCKRSNVAHARIARIDAGRALALPGVKAVLTHEDVPRVLHAGSPHPRSASLKADQYILDHKVRFWGEVVAAVAATSEEVAEQALDLIDVKYEALPAALTIEQAVAADAPVIHDDKVADNNVIEPLRVRRGDPEQGFADADLVIEGEYVGARPSPAYMEPNVCTCQWDSHGGLTLWISTQTGFMVRGIMAEVLGVPYHQVRVLMDYMGGGFGAKQDLFQSEFLCALLARQTQRPVRMEWSREESFVGGRSRHPVNISLKQGFKRNGAIIARQARLIVNCGAYASHGPGVTNVATFGLTSLYRCDNLELESRLVYTNTPVGGAYRGFGVMQITYALDAQMDEAAERLGLDPLQVKLKNAVREGDTAPSGHALVGHGLGDCIERGKAEVGWPDVRHHAADAGVRRRGWGMGCEMHGSGADPAIQEQGNALVRMNEDGTVRLYTGATDLGTGAYTTLAQIVAECIGVRFEDVAVTYGDTDVVPWDIGAFASHTTFVAGRATQQAAMVVHDKLLALASERLEVAATDLEIVNSEVRVRGTDIVHNVRDVVAARSGVPAAALLGDASRPSKKSYSFAAHFVEVEVDTETGKIAVLQVVPVHELGKVINPIGASGQIEGGIQQGIGHTLYENFEVDLTTGRPLNANFTDFKTPMASDMPAIRPILLETAPDPGGPFGAKGIGEDPIVAIGPAIVNAVHDAIGVRFRHYPITPEDVLGALNSNRSCPPEAAAKAVGATPA